MPWLLFDKILKPSLDDFGTGLILSYWDDQGESQGRSQSSLSLMVVTP